MEKWWGFIGAAAAIFGIIFGIQKNRQYRKEKSKNCLNEEYLKGVEAGTLRSDMDFVKGNVVEILREQKSFRAEQERVNKRFDERLTGVEKKLDEHIKNHVKGG